MSGASETRTALTLATGAFVDELVRAGVRHFSVSPGSRSTPLALLLARHSGAKLWMHLDERSNAFFGLGLAKALREPVALVCTSGTAAANFLPAVVEARYGRVPLVVLTADRPHELRDVGAPQTIDQVGLYGAHAKWFCDLEEPSGEPDLVRHARTVASRAVATARRGPPGPVHVNLPFREPLVPAPAVGEAFAAGRAGGGPWVAVAEGRAVLDETSAARLAARLSGTERGLLVCGPQEDPALPSAVSELAAQLGFPILADPLSGVRCGPHDRSLVLDAYDAFLRDPAFATAQEPEVVLRFGAMPTSKPVLQYLERHPACWTIVVDGDGGWEEPTGLAAEIVHADGALMCRQIAASLASQQAIPLSPGEGVGLGGYSSGARLTPERREDPSPGPADGCPHQRLRPFPQERRSRGRSFSAGGAEQPGLDGVRPIARPASAWQRTWLAADRAAREAVARSVAGHEDMSEPRVFAELAELLPEGAALWAGSSMPVRDLDTFFSSTEKQVRFLSNRGANGIDGVVSSALGASVGVEGPLVLAIGDISLYHDSNGLMAAKRHGLDVTIVLLNNDGGGIFSFLPQAEEPEHFEDLFGTPHGLDFRPIVEAYGGCFTPAGDWSTFREAVRRGIERGGLNVVEVRTDRRRNVQQHREIWPAVFEAVSQSSVTGGVA